MSEQADGERIGGGRLNAMILVSLLFHGLVLSLLFFAPSIPSPKLTFGPIYTVSLVDFSGSAPEQKRDKAVAKELLESPSAGMVVKKLLESEPVVPIRSRESRAKRDQDLEKAMQEIRKRAAAAPKPPEPLFAAEKAGPASQASPADLNAKMKAYYAMIKFRINGKWTYPQGILPGEQWETWVDIKILRNGAVVETNIEKRSGNRYFDESVLKAIRKAGTLPPLPEWFGENSHDVVIRFHSSELKP